MLRQSVRRAILAGGLAAGAALATLAVSTPAQAQASGRSCTIKVPGGEIVASYTSQGSIFGTMTHVDLVTTGPKAHLVYDRLWLPSGKPLRGVVGDVTSSRGWNARSGIAPARLSVGVLVGATPGACHT
jgi:hypothetical protein